jgi:hypothetical protein
VVNYGLTDENILSLAINPKFPTTLYAGSEGGGVFRSTNSGAAWTAVNTGLANWGDRYAFSLAVNPVTPTTLYVGTSGDVLRSTDSGTTWIMVNNHDFHSAAVWSIVINPANPSTLYGGSYDGVLRSRDTGATWTAVNSGLTSQSITSLAINPKTPTTLYAGTSSGVFRYGAVSSSKSVIQLTIGRTTMYVDGKPTTLEAPPIILNSRTLLPIRAVVEATGGTIIWEASTQRVTITRGNTTLELWIGQNVAKLNGQSVSIDSDARVVPVIRSGRTLLPLRFVAESLALDVQWDATTQMITITYTP